MLRAGTGDQRRWQPVTLRPLEGAGHVFLVLVVIIAVLMLVVVPRMRRKR
jgi:hypothetical protein